MDTRLLIGARLPDVYFKRVLDRTHGKVYLRQCCWCGLEWTGVEVALATKWEGAAADCCPWHPDEIGRVLGGRTAKKVLESPRMEHQGVTKCALLGGYIRRRECRRDDCDYRWTTTEFYGDGTVGKDVGECARCGGPATTTNSKMRNYARSKYVRKIARPLMQARLAAVSAVDPACLKPGLVEVAVEPRDLRTKSGKETVFRAERYRMTSGGTEDSVFLERDEAGPNGPLQAAERRVRPGVDEEVEDLLPD